MKQSCWSRCSKDTTLFLALACSYEVQTGLPPTQRTAPHKTFGLFFVSCLFLCSFGMKQKPDQKPRHLTTKASTMDSTGRHLFAWGNNFQDQLGLGDAFSDINEVPAPTKVSIQNVTWTQIACGLCHTVALSINGEVFTWGNNNYGQLGHDDDVRCRNAPTKVESLSGVTIVKIACGAMFTAAVTDRGKLLTW